MALVGAVGLASGCALVHDPGASPAPAVSSPVVLGHHRPLDTPWRLSGGSWHTGGRNYTATADGEWVALTLPSHGGIPGATVRVATVRVGNVPVTAVNGSLDPQGALSMDRGGVVERLRGVPAGMEQSWTFTRRPMGSADIRVRLEGVSYVGADAMGRRRDRAERVA